VLVEAAVPGEEGPRRFAVERARAYRDRLVLKLRGIDEPNAAEALRGRRVLAPADEVPELPPGVHFIETLVGLEVRQSGEILGRVVDLLETGGTDVLVVLGPGGREILLPLAREMVGRISAQEGVLEVKDLPEGLVELNDRATEGPS
jgi:16S rRNA processing protein RimM